MTDLPLHPAIVHVPLGLAVVMPLVAAALTWAIWRGKLPRGAFAIVAGLQLVLSSAGFVAMDLGHDDAKKAETVAPRHAIEQHEEAAETLVWVSVGMLALSLATLFVPRSKAPLLAAVATAGTLAVTALALDAGMKGGELVFRYGAGAVTTQSTAPAAERAKGE
jgi:uncharacterized membrane protein